MVHTIILQKFRNDVALLQRCVDRIQTQIRTHRTYKYELNVAAACKPIWGETLSRIGTGSISFKLNAFFLSKMNLFYLLVFFFFGFCFVTDKVRVILVCHNFILS